MIVEILEEPSSFSFDRPYVCHGKRIRVPLGLLTKRKKRRQSRELHTYQYMRAPADHTRM